MNGKPLGKSGGAADVASPDLSGDSESSDDALPTAKLNMRLQNGKVK
jgi:hypothetical protein